MLPMTVVPVAPGSGPLKGYMRVRFSLPEVEHQRLPPRGVSTMHIPGARRLMRLARTTPPPPTNAMVSQLAMV